MLMSDIRILYVEDEPSLGKIVKDSLESRDFDVNLVRDGAHVITQFHKHSPHICVLDVMLPNKDGFTLGEEIRSIDDKIPIIFLTAKTQTKDLINGFNAGGNDYIKKPFSMEELIARINNLLKLTQQAKDTSNLNTDIAISKYVFHPQKFALSKNGKEIKLSNRETELLKILVKNLNQSVPRKEILQYIWGNDSIFNSRTLDVYVTKIRNYFKDDPNIKLITLKGVGYCFFVENKSTQ